MADDATLRGRRSYRHRKGDHSLCRPERCEHVGASGPVLRFSPKVQSDLVEAYRSGLEAAGRLDSPEGELVMVLAERLVQPSHTASALATLSRELRAAFDAAVKDAPRAIDAFDELAKRRADRAAGA